MFKKIFGKPKKMNSNIAELYKHVKANKKESINFREINGGKIIHDILIKCSTSDFKNLETEIIRWKKIERNILIDALIYGLGGKYRTLYDNEKRIIINSLYSKLQNSYTPPEHKKWMKDYIVHSKTKSNNQKIINVYDYLLQHQDIDHNYWSCGAGWNEIQNRLSKFSQEDWKLLKLDILNWSDDDAEILIEAIGFEDYRQILNKEQINFAGEFLLDLFFEDFKQKNEIIDSCIPIISKSDRTNIEKLKTLHSWLIKNKYDEYFNLNFERNPVKYLGKVIEYRINKIE